MSDQDNARIAETILFKKAFTYRSEQTASSHSLEMLLTWGGDEPRLA